MSGELKFCKRCGGPYIDAKAHEILCVTPKRPAPTEPTEEER